VPIDSDPADGVAPVARAALARDARAGSAAGGPAAMSAAGLTLGYGQNTVLADVTIDFLPGRITALLGPTGSGKSTLLRTLNRMNDKISGYRRQGDVTLDGQSIWSPGLHPMALRRKVGMLFQRPNPFPMSIADNVVAGVRTYERVPRGVRQAEGLAVPAVGRAAATAVPGPRAGGEPRRAAPRRADLLP
jgi:phosphate transport system ATP-binding protein